MLLLKNGTEFQSEDLKIEDNFDIPKTDVMITLKCICMKQDLNMYIRLDLSETRQGTIYVRK